MLSGKVVSVNVSRRKGVGKDPVEVIALKAGLGVEGDAHAGGGERQASLMAVEAIEEQNRVLKERSVEPCEKVKKKAPEIGPGSYAENITTSGLDLKKLPVGTQMRIGKTLLRITKIGKDCHKYCAIYYKVGDCIMPREGIFCEVLEGGEVRAGDPIEIEKGRGSSPPEL